MTYWSMTNISTGNFTNISVEHIPAIELDAFNFLSEWIITYTGLHFPKNKEISLYRRLSSLALRLGMFDLNEMVLHLKMKDRPDLPSEIARTISTNHSFFFRELEVLQFFHDHIIPTLPAEPSWRIWSAAAAGGEEAYTLAIILAEAIGLKQAIHQVSILGTDISYPMISNAEDGIYHKQKLEMVDASILKRYFRPDKEDHMAISPAIKPMCTFRRINLNRVPWPFQNMFHVIFCRNVLYYFDRPTQEELVERFYDVTLPGGWMVTSVTESLYWAKTRWRPVTTGVYRKI